MKRILLLALSLFAAVSCYDDSALWEEIKDHENRIVKLETLCNQMNTNITSLQTIVSALQSNDFITNVSPVTENGKEIGYTITFSKSGTITVYHGKDGKDGENGKDGTDGEDGKDGKDGQNGQDGAAPVIGVKQDTDGVYYWTLNGDWLRDSDGNKIPTTGKDGEDGITPKLKIEEGYWYVSYDNGKTWERLEKAVAENGGSGDCFFSDVMETADAVILTLATGDVITLAKLDRFDIVFENLKDILCDAGDTVSVPFTITGAVEDITINCLGENGWKATASMTTSTTGVVAVSVPDPVVDGQVLVLVSNEKYQTIVKALTFEEKVLKSVTDAYQVGHGGGDLQVEVSSNMNYSVIIPDEDKSWCSLVETKAVRTDVLTFRVSENEGHSDRSAEIDIVSEDETKSFTITVYQFGPDSAIIFADPVMEACCVTAFDADGDGELSYAEAARVTDMSSMDVPYSAVSFDEFRYFTSLTAIGDAAFQGCEALKSITIPSSVTSIGDYAFHGCYSLTEMMIPEGVVSIGPYAFCMCHWLTNITIPSSVTSIGESAFFGCDGLTEIMIPEGVVSIGERAFEACHSLKSITIPSSVTSIGDYAFANCLSLTEIMISEGVVSIGKSAFSVCMSLKSITIPSSVTSIGDGAFHGCYGLTELMIPEGVVSIGKFAFAECESLVSVTVPASVTYIGGAAFKGCPLKSIFVSEGNAVYHSDNEGNAIIETATNTLIFVKADNPFVPEGVTSIGDYAFYGYYDMSDITIPEGVVSIGDNAFSNCKSLTSITIPSSVTSIGESAFESCVNVDCISVADENPVYDSRNGCNAIIETASNTLIQGCKNSFIPQGVTSIGDRAFFGHTGLESITIPEGVVSIGEFAFSTTGLTSITIPDGVVSIGMFAFSTTGLTSITIPDGVVSIGMFAFSTTGLTSIVIPSSVSSIGPGAFNACQNLRSIYVKASTPPELLPFVGGLPGFLGDGDFTIYVPAASLETYKASWSRYASCIVGYDFENDAD